MSLSDGKRFASPITSFVTAARLAKQAAITFDRLHPERTKHKLVQRLERLGHKVTLEPRD